MFKKLSTYAALTLVFTSPLSFADESLLGRVKGSETLPAGALELDQTLTFRSGKGTGEYDAVNSKTELEYGFSDSFTGSAYIKMQGIDTSGIVVDGYLPGAEEYTLRFSGIEVSGKYNFLSPALDDFGLSTYVSLGYDWLDTHSGRDKDKTTLELQLLTQKYFMEGQLIWMGNVGLEATYAKRGAIDNLPVDFEWPTHPEMEIGLLVGTGVSYRFANNWFAGIEAIYETEFETEVGQERYSVFAGPTLHYATSQWWASFSWLPQITGGGEQFDAQNDFDLHLIEKTEDEFIFKFGLNF